MRFYALLLLILFFSSSASLLAQDATKLEAERKALLKDIKQTSKLLSSTRNTQATAIDEFYTIQRQIEQREKLIRTLQKETNEAAIIMEQSAMAVDSLELDIEKLKIEYSAMIRQAFRSKVSHNEWVFLFSAESFNQALKRWRYIQQYDEYRKKQVHLILETQTALKAQIRALETNKNKQEQLILSEEAQRSEMEAALAYKGKILSQLKKDEYQISGLLRQQKRAHERLNQAVESVIVANIGEQEDKDEMATAKTKTNTNVTPTKNISADVSYQFTINKGKLTWPIQNGIITRYFGDQAHPIHKKIRINNNGIDIRARSDRTVFSLFEGIVTAIQIVPGYQNTLILQHGDYYSVYSNLQSLKVKKGDIVLAQQAIGEVGINNQKDYPELHLEIWKGKKRLNPFGWLKRL